MVHIGRPFCGKECCSLMKALYNRYKYFLAKAMSLVAVAVVLMSFSQWAAAAYAHDQQVEEQIAEAERAANRGPFATDGDFEGSAKGYGGTVTMRVTVLDGYVDAVEIVDASHEDDAWLDMCQGIPDAVVKAQSTGVDTVSGATYTSAAMLNACTEALRKSMDGGEAA